MSHRRRSDTSPTLQDRAIDLGAALAFGVLRVLPYEKRIAAFGWLGRHVIAPLAGMRARIRANLAHVWPELPPAQVRALTRLVPDNMARTLAEIFTGAPFIARARASPVEGPGLAALDAAHAEGRPVVLVTAHLGNYDAVRAYLLGRGFAVGGFYMPMTNPAFNRRYVRAISGIGTPVFARDRDGMAQMLRFLRKGGMVGMVADHYMKHGVLMDFMGKTARTSLAVAEIALKYQALMVPVYGIRQPDGVSFVVRIEDPIPHTDPETMTRALHISTEAQIIAHPEQWMWTHKRWRKGDRTRA
jgi:KDO2-lipid IV(A) lauroyltransferase